MCTKRMKVNKNGTGAMTASENGLFQKKIKQGGVEDMEFPQVPKK